MADPPPPPPPPHGQNPRPPGAMPDGNYDIFIIPPHSAGSGFLYLPSLQPQRNSFLAGAACALLAVAVYVLAVPVLKQWYATIMAGGGGIGVLLLVAAVGVGGWAWGKTQGENHSEPGAGGGSTAGAGRQRHEREQNAEPKPGEEVPPRNQPPPPPPPPPPPQPDPKSPPRPKPNPAASGWEKAREETRKREEERKRAEEVKKKREEAQKAREEAEKAAKIKAEKEKWEQARAREKEQREREARERIARERIARENDTRAREAREKAGAGSARSSPTKPVTSRYEKPTVRSYAETVDERPYRPHGSPPKHAAYKSSASSVSGLSESSYAPSHSTARTTPPPSQRGPYSTKDPDKIQIKAVYLFTDSFPTKPVASLVSGQASVTDGLILRIKTEGLFIDDDVRGVPQREWDVKAWTLKLVEDGMCKSTAGLSFHVLRATSRDAENKKYTFVLDETEAWKVAVGLQRLRKGSQVRALGMNGMKEAEAKGLLTSLGWL